MSNNTLPAVAELPDQEMAEATQCPVCSQSLYDEWAVCKVCGFDGSHDATSIVEANHKQYRADLKKQRRDSERARDSERRAKRACKFRF